MAARLPYKRDGLRLLTAGLSLACAGAFPAPFLRMISAFLRPSRSRPSLFFCFSSPSRSCLPLPPRPPLPGTRSPLASWWNQGLLPDLWQRARSLPTGKLFTAPGLQLISCQEYLLCRDLREQIALVCSPCRRGRKILPLYLRQLFLELAQKHPGLLFSHGLGIVTPAAPSSRAFLFLGPSGSGKTTLGRTWPRDLVLSDENVILREIRDRGPGRRWRTYATPWCSPELVPRKPLSAPLAAVCLLKHGNRLALQRIPPRRAAAALLRNQEHIWGKPDPLLRKKARCLAAGVPCFNLAFRKETTVSEILARLRDRIFPP